MLRRAGLSYCAGWLRQTGNILDLPRGGFQPDQAMAFRNTSMMERMS